MAASDGRIAYVLGGYSRSRQPLRSAFALRRGAWRRLPPLPAGRAAAASAVVRGRLLVVGGVGPEGLARRAFALDLRRLRWTSVVGPTPREHLAVASTGNRVYAIGGRTAGFDTNLALTETWTPGARRWRRIAPVPEPRGGTGAAVLRGLVVSVGGEAPSGTLERGYALRPRTNRWTRLSDLPTARHGLGVVSLGGRLYAIAGGPRPGLTVSGANEFLRFG